MHCLRCGAKIKENRSFCDDCAERVQEPLEDSPYLHTQIVLPTRKAAPVPKRPEPKKERKKRPWRWIVSTWLLLLLCLALLTQGGWYFGTWLKTQAALRQTETERAVLQQQIDLLRESLAATEQENAVLENALATLQNELTETQTNLEYLQQKIQNLSHQIVFVEEDGTNTFHRQGCVRFESTEFRAFIRDEAVRRGYDPCKLCLP